MTSTVSNSGLTGEFPSSAPAIGDVVDGRQSAVLELGRRAIVSPGAESLLEDAAALLAETLGCSFCSVARPDGSELVSVDFSMGSSGKFEDHWMSPRDPGLSLAGYAMATGQPVVVADFGAEDRFVDGDLSKLHVRSALCAPLTVADEALGALAVYSTALRTFTTSDVHFVETIANIVAMTIARQRAEAALADARRFTGALLSSVEALVIVLSPDFRIVEMNKAAERTIGFALSEVKQRLLWTAFLVPEEGCEVKARLEQLESAAAPLQIETFVLTKQADRKRIEWTFVVTRDGDGNVESLLGTGIDVTEKKELAKLLEQSNKTLAKLRTAGVSVDVDRAVDEAENPERPFARMNEKNAERRSKPRRNFPYIQLIAPIKNGLLPPRTAFREIRCRDIAAGGFSFLTSEALVHKELVVALGVGANLTFLTARVVHEVDQTKDGKPLYLIGCQYTGRAHYD
jgi:PAS domain S-box-containing protein